MKQSIQSVYIYIYAHHFHILLISETHLCRLYFVENENIREK